jgi:hypothetical protein
VSENLSMIRGDDETLSMALVDGDGEPFDLTDCTLYFTVGDHFTKTSELDGGITVDPDPTTGLASIAIAAADTDDFPDTRYATPYAVRVVRADDTIKTPIRGLFIVIPVPEPVT